MSTKIKYEELTMSMKGEIEKFFNSEKESNKELRFEDAMEIWFESEFEQWVIDRTKGPLRERRKNFRFDIELPVKIVETVNEKSKSNKADSLKQVGDIVNMSKSGLYFKSKKPLKVSSVVKILIDFSKIDKELDSVDALAMVVRVDKLGNGEYANSVMFSKINDNAKKNMNYYIFKSMAFQQSQLNKLFFY
jgi:hypothetical protein